MEYRIPHYFNQFRCAAAECDDTCCAGWAILIDEDTLEKYERTEGPFGNRLKNSIDWEEGAFLKYDNRCAFLNDQNLCDIQMEAGEQMLCDTCREYPRHREEFDGLREGSLSLSCIEAAKLILGCREPVTFYTLEDEEEEEEEFEDYDYLLFTKLMDAREKIIGFLQKRDVDIMIRIAMCLEFADHLQKALEEGNYDRMDEETVQFGSMNHIFAFQKKAENFLMGESSYVGDMRKIFRVLGKLEVLDAGWPEHVKKGEKALFGEGQKAYCDKKERFHKSVGLKSNSYETWSLWLEQLMVYFVFTYFCGAVYDGNILGKLKTAVVSVLLVEELSVGRWSMQKEQFSFEDMVDLSHRVSREIEHSDLNLGRLEKLFDTLPVMETESLIKIVTR